MAKSMEEIASLLKNTHFKRKFFGGVDEADVWRKLERLQKEYTELIEFERLKNEAAAAASCSGTAKPAEKDNG